MQPMQLNLLLNVDFCALRTSTAICQYMHTVLTPCLLDYEGALGSVCALRGLVAFWQGQCRQLEAQLHIYAEAAASAKRTAAADMAALSADVADREQRLQAAQQMERQLRQQQALLEVRTCLHQAPYTLCSRCRQMCPRECHYIECTGKRQAQHI